MQTIMAKILGCERVGHVFPPPEEDEGGIMYFKRKLESKCAVCERPYEKFLKEDA